MDIQFHTHSTFPDIFTIISSQDQYFFPLICIFYYFVVILKQGQLSWCCYHFHLYRISGYLAWGNRMFYNLFCLFLRCISFAIWDNSLHNANETLKLSTLLTIYIGAQCWGYPCRRGKCDFSSISMFYIQWIEYLHTQPKRREDSEYVKESIWGQVTTSRTLIISSCWSLLTVILGIAGS